MQDVAPRRLQRIPEAAIQPSAVDPPAPASGTLRALAAGVAVLVAATAFAGPDTMPEVFKRRILPIFQAKDPSSCRECHLTGVDLKDYLSDDPRRAFLSLRDQGLADPANPNKSRILDMISMAPKGSPVVTQALRAKEREAFLEWLTACAADPELVAAPRLSEAERSGPKAPPAVIRHARTDRLLQSFEDSIWADRGRCESCHDPRKNEKQRAAEGERVSWIVPEDPAATFARMEERKYFDAKDPAKSLILLKPTLKVKHGGGEKMAPGDRGYLKWLAFVEDFAKTKAGSYRAEGDLPAPPPSVLVNSDLWLRVESNGDWEDKVVVVELFAWDAAAKGYEKDAIAVSTRRADKKGWQHTLYLTAAAGSDRAKKFAASPRLDSGKYLARVYVDRRSALAKDPSARLSDADLAGTIEVDRAFDVGYGAMAKLGAPVKTKGR